MSLSVVAPVHDEAAVLLELGRRCVVAARRADADAEVILVDDASRDATPTLAAALPPGARLHRLDANRGQLGATKVGLGLARGDVVVVLDGDLQDPPEHIPDLVAALRADPRLDVVFAVKATRAEGPLFRVARGVYGLLAALPGTRVVPAGAGAYCAMRRPVAERAARVRIERANLAAVLVALGARAAVVPYAKAARYDDTSRVGAVGLLREGIGSLVLTGAAGTVLAALALGALLASWLLGAPAPLGLVAFSVLWTARVLVELRRHRALRPGEP